MHARRLSQLGAAGVLLVLATSLSPPSAADPIVIDEGSGIGRATWDFVEPSDYTVSNVSLQAGRASLASSHQWWNHTSDAEFLAAQESGTNVTVASGLRLTENPLDMLTDGTFAQSPGPWAYANGTTGQVLAGRDAGERARLSHWTSRVQFDAMDDILGANPWAADWQGGGWFSAITQENAIRQEGTGSMRSDFSIGPAGGGSYASVFRDDAGTWDWSAYNRMAIRIESTNATGVGVGVVLSDLGGPQAFAWIPGLPPAWGRYVFDLTPFSGNSTSIDRVDIGFFGPIGSHTAYIDDLVLFNFTDFQETSTVSQSFVKPIPTSGDPLSLSLRFDVEATASPGVVPYLKVDVGGFGWSESPIPSGTRTLTLDLSGDSALQANGSFTLTFSLELIRFGAEEASLTVWLDNVTLVGRDYDSGLFTALPSDAGSPGIWTISDLQATTNPPASGIVVETRTGNSSFPGDPSWTPWDTVAGLSIQSPPNRFLQWRVSLNTLDGSETPIVTRLSLRSERYEPAGAVRTASFLPSEPLRAWRTFHASDTRPPGTSIRYEVSVDGAMIWVPVLDGDDLSGLAATPALVRATLSTANTSRSPSVTSLTLRYQYEGTLASIDVLPTSASASADDVLTFTATARDNFGQPLASFGCIWSTDDPWGQATGNGTLIGTYLPGRAGGPWRVSCTDSGGSISGTAFVTVTPGALVAIVLSPPNAVVPLDELQTFAAEGRDADGNTVTLTATVWSTTIGTLAASDAVTATLHASVATGSGVLTATQGAVSGNASVLVAQAGTPRINGTIPDLAGDEDSGPWTWDLTAFTGNQSDAADTPDNLRWTMGDGDSALYTVVGLGVYGVHRLVVLPSPNAFGIDDVRLFLEDRQGRQSFQDLAVTIRPVDDPPFFWTWPGDLFVRHGEPYTFDWTPYVRDIDTPVAALNLTTEDAANIAIVALNATYTYPSSFLGQTLFIRHAVSDGSGTDEIPIAIRVTDNLPPQVVAPLPDLTVAEDTTVRDVFSPTSLRTYFDDGGGDQLFFSHNYTNLIVDIWDDTGSVRVNVTGAENFCGSDRITFRAADSRGAFAEYTVRVLVLCVNDPPVLSWTDDIHVRFDQRYRLDLAPFIFDVETPPEDLTLTASDSLAAIVEGLEISLLYTRARLGPASSYTLPLNLTLADPTSATARNLRVIVSDNRPPELLQPIESLEFDEDTTARVDLEAYFWDYEDGPALAYGGEGGDLAIAFDASGVTLTPAPDWSGQEIVVLRGTDSQGAFILGYLPVTVLPINDAPTLTGLPAQLQSGGGTWVLDLRPYASDVEDDPSGLRFSVSGSARVEVFGFLLMFQYPNQDASEHLVVTVEDSGGATDRSEVSVRVVGPSPWSVFLSPWAALIVLSGAVAGYVAWKRFPWRVIPESLFLIGQDGRLIAQLAAPLKTGVDDDLMAGMLTAITAFARDSFREENEELNRFELGNRTVVVEHGKHEYLAAVYNGTLPQDVVVSLREFLTDLYERYGEKLVDWLYLDDLPGVEAMLTRFSEQGRYRQGDWATRGTVPAPEAAGGT